MTAKVSIQELQKMIREAVALQLSKNKDSAAEQRQKMKDDKEKSMKKENVQKITLEQLRSMVKEAITTRLKEQRVLRESMGEIPAEGDLVSFNGKTGFVVQVAGDRVAISRDGIKMETIPLAGVRVLATSEDLNELNPDELDLIGNEMGYNQNADPGEDPQTELDRVTGQLTGGNMLAGGTRKSLSNREDQLKAQLGISDMEEGSSPLAEEPYDRENDGYMARMSWGQMPSDDLWAKAMVDGWHWRLGKSDREAFSMAMEMAGLNPHQAEAGMNTPEGMKAVIRALSECYSEDPKLAQACENAHNLASSVMDHLGFEWI